MGYRLIWIYALLTLISVNLSNQDSGLMKDIPFGFLNQTNQTSFEGNDNTVVYSHQTRRSSWSLPKFLKGFIYTRVMPWIYIFIIILSLPLNGLALVLFTCKIREKTPAVIYMSHLAFADLFFTLLLPLKIHYQMNETNWVFGEAACRVLTASYYGNMYCSVLLMMCISVDRLLAVAFPIASMTWRSARKATHVCVAVWLLTLGGIVPLLMMNQTLNYRAGISCTDYQADPLAKLYFFVFLILLCIYFILPMIVILVSYTIIIYVLCAKPENFSSSSDTRRRAAIIATAVLIEFVVCFIPSNVLLLNHFVRLRNGSIGWDTYTPYLLAVCLGSSSVFLDPLLYYFGSSQYRQQIHSVFCALYRK